MNDFLCDPEAMPFEAGYVLVVQHPAQVLATQATSLSESPSGASSRAEDGSELSARWEARAAHLTRLSP